MSKWTNYVGDPWEDVPIHSRPVPTPVYAPGEFSEFVAHLLAALAKPELP